MRAFGLILFLALTAGPLARGDANASTEISDDDEARFGEKLAATIARGDVQAAARTVDSAALTTRALDGLDLPDTIADACRLGVIENINSALIKMFTPFKQAHFLRVDHRGTERRVLLRLVAASGDASYLGFECNRRKNGELTWYDTFDYVFDENFSVTMRRLAGPALVALGRSALAGSDSEIKHLIEIAPIAKLVQDEKYAEALAAIHALPPERQKSGILRLLRFRLARQTSPEEFISLADEWEQEKPDDPAIVSARFYIAILRKDYPAAIAKARTFDQLIGGDAYQEYIIGRLHRLASESSAARLAARHALTREPTFTPAYDLLLDLAVDAGNTADVVDLLQEIEMKFPGADMAKAIAQDPKYAPTRASPIYAAWLRVRFVPAAKPPSP
ncbi:MAG TPA: hypothetical protein VHD32_00360 [Candidatus Didemnitutus sp.]|nr:hypothetical protein [Candidatus Didemnitutus sp.]